MLERDWRGNPVRVGDMVWPGRPLARIPDLDEMQAEVFVLEADAGDVASGQPTTVWLESHPDNPVTATVGSIDPMAGRRSRRSPVQYFRTVLALDETDTAVMKPGARVRAEITIADLADAITVPRQVVCSLDGEPVVYRWDGDIVALRDPTATDRAARPDEAASAPPIPGGRP